MVDQVELLERVARIIDPAAWRIADDGGRGGLERALDYSVERAKAALEASRHVELVEALEQIRDLSGSGYDSDRAWALAMQLRARVVLQGWLPPYPTLPMPEGFIDPYAPDAAERVRDALNRPVPHPNNPGEV